MLFGGVKLGRKLFSLKFSPSLHILPLLNEIQLVRPIFSLHIASQGFTFPILFSTAHLLLSV